MATFLFWNVNGNPLEGVVRNLARRHDVDVMVLVESAIPPGRMLETLNSGIRRMYHFASPALRGIAIYMRYSLSQHRVIDQDPGTRVTIREIATPLGMDILLVAVHLPSKRGWSDRSQALWCSRLADRIRRAEERVGHSNTVLVGDLNMNPFEDGLIAATGLHATMARDVARRGSRTIKSGEDFPYFYNPMWPLFGDAGVGRPSGTYYYRRGEPVEFFWNMFDQVLVRPALLDVFRNEELTILTDNGSTRLLSSTGRPRKRAFSDHLPVAFTLDL